MERAGVPVCSGTGRRSHSDSATAGGPPFHRRSGTRCVRAGGSVGRRRRPRRPGEGGAVSHGMGGAPTLTRLPRDVVRGVTAVTALRLLQARHGKAEGGDLICAFERRCLEGGDLVRQAVKLFGEREQGFGGGGLRSELGNLGGEVGEGGEHVVDGRFQGGLLVVSRHGHGTKAI